MGLGRLAFVTAMPSPVAVDSVSVLAYTASAHSR